MYRLAVFEIVKMAMTIRVNQVCPDCFGSNDGFSAAYDRRHRSVAINLGKLAA